MGSLLQLSLALAAVIAVGVLPVEEKLVPIGEPKTHFVALYLLIYAAPQF